MTEREWLDCVDPAPMFDFLLCGSERFRGEAATWSRRPFDRKLRLYACACCLAAGQMAPDRWEGEGPWEQSCNTDAAHWARHWVSQLADHEPSLQVRADILRDIFGNPFHAVTLPTQDFRGSDGTIVKCPALQPWEPIFRVAYGIYAEQAFDRMPQLWDTLADAGCEDAAIRDHCLAKKKCQRCTGHTFEPGYIEMRGMFDEQSDVPMDVICPDCRGTTMLDTDTTHVRGCWVLDIILGRT